MGSGELKKIWKFEGLLIKKSPLIHIRNELSGEDDESISESMSI